MVSGQGEPTDAHQQVSVRQRTNLSGMTSSETRRGRDKESSSSGHPSEQLRSFRPAVWTPSAPAHHSFHAGGLQAVINDYPMAPIKAKGRALLEALTLRAGGWVEGKVLSRWACRDRICLEMPQGGGKETRISLASATPWVMMVGS